VVILVACNKFGAPTGDFHPVTSRPCWAHTPPSTGPPASCAYRFTPAFGLRRPVTSNVRSPTSTPMPAYPTPTLGAIALAMAVASLALGLWNAYTTRRLHQDTQRQKALGDLQAVANQINEALAKYEVDGPYQVRLGFKGNSEARGKISVLVLYLNYLRVVFNNQNVLGPEVVADTKVWAIRVLGPWIAGDDILLKTYSKWLGEADGGRDYTDWVMNLMPLKAAIPTPGESNSAA
jgi:hypothetical protein